MASLAAGPLQHEVALVTGATSGIGEAIARRFAAEGARVAVVGRDARRGNAVVAGIAAAGGCAAFFAADVTHDAAVRDLIADVLARFGDLSILVNNAGRSVPGTVVNTTAAEWEEVWRVNVSSAFLTSHHAVPRLLERGGGCVVHIASEAGLKGLKDRAAYCAAKAAIVGLTKAMAVDHSPHGVRVNCICPGTVETPMVAELIETHANPAAMKDAFLERRLTPYLGTPEDIAEAALYMVLPRNRYLTGAVLSVDGGSLAR
ncbi:MULTISPECIES: SDR family NAD(P)-dependent oxidoreductase [Cupriavidus]|uniref:2-(S)-hydroxypropyl-CoM dehydrogenase n=2 Tax=Cupriavidus TaxID=106589 RepID=A0ABN7ZHB6_9BURK|nr:MULTISPECIES: glucose 1-dehydrogenase [Cupriavidus]CAG9166297.1 2-(S)-hydroxypropyl-CoM dehydrogenase [Cupriavidus pinatubonensis]CAG9185379.1 2-(S)-hydroxypropyl-CoM dehydrogenase [Cupriavidus laharis]